MYIYIYIYILFFHIHTCMYTYIYIYIERERDILCKPRPPAARTPAARRSPGPRRPSENLLGALFDCFDLCFRIFCHRRTFRGSPVPRRSSESFYFNRSLSIMITDMKVSSAVKCITVVN